MVNGVLSRVGRLTDVLGRAWVKSGGSHLLSLGGGEAKARNGIASGYHFACPEEQASPRGSLEDSAWSSILLGLLTCEMLRVIYYTKVSSTVSSIATSVVYHSVT